MPKKGHHETQEEQSERFRKLVRDLINAGELDPAEADDRFDKLMGRVVPPHPTKD